MPDSAQSGTIDDLLEYPPDTRLIWKYELRPWSIFIDIPKGADILSAGAQGSDVVVWAMVDPNAPKVPRMVAALPTGTARPMRFSDTRFVATVQMNDGLVFHVFDGGERA